jgi:DNA-binding Lrp family transcriptional regulator
VEKMLESERRILLELLKDAGRSIVEIAEATNLSRQTVAERIKALRGKIRFTVRVDPAELGLKTRALVFLKEKPDPSLRRRLEEHVLGMKEVARFFRIFGRYSGVLEVLVRSEEELSAVIQELHRTGGVEETETFIIRSTIKEEQEDPFIRILQEQPRRALRSP